MCGRFSLSASKEKIEEQLDVTLPLDYAPRYNIAPSQNVLSIVSDGSRLRSGYLKWGLVPAWVKDPKIGYNMINARSETLEEKPAFRTLLERRRCVVVADGFYEWKRDANGKTPYRMTTNEDIITFAALWDRWRGEREEIVSCTIITTSPNDLVKNIHDRMPVILNEEKRNIWLDPSVQTIPTLKSLLTPYESESMKAYIVSNIVNSPKNDTEDCIRSLA